MPPSFSSRPTDATLSVTKAARLLGVHPNTIRTWSDAGRLRYFRINSRGDRRYRLGDLQRFLASAAPSTAVVGPSGHGTGGARRAGTASASEILAAATRPRDGDVDPLAAERHRLDLSVSTALARLASQPSDGTSVFEAAAGTIRDTYGHRHVSIWELHGDRLSPTVVAVASDAVKPRLTDLPRTFGILGAALGIGAVGARRPRAGRWRAAGQRPRDGHAAGRARRPTRAGDRDPGPGWAVGRPAARGRDGRIARAARPRRGAKACAAGLGALVSATRRGAEIDHLRHRAEALRRVASDIGSRLDLNRILTGLVDHAMVLFEGDAAAVFLQRHDGTIAAEVSRGLSNEYLNSLRRSRLARSRRRPSRPAGRSSPSATATTHAAPTSERPSSRRASTRCARRRFATAAPSSACSTSITTARTRGRMPSSRRSPSWPTRRASRSGPRRTTTGWRPGRRSCSRSSSSAPASTGCRA